MENIEYVVAGMIFVVWLASMIISYHWGLRLGLNMEKIEEIKE